VPVRALARVNLAAIERNVERLRSELTGGATLCAVVKANGYGHGALPAARAAIDGGATRLAVATAEEAAQLRAGQIEQPILVMGAISTDELPAALGAGAEVVAWSEEFVATLAAAAPTGGGSPPLAVHVKLDSGMGRLGTRDAAPALALADRIAAADGLELRGAMTHFATADDDPAYMAAQLSVFEPFATELRHKYPGILVHAANSAAVLRSAETHFDFVRCGIAVYGLDPMNQDSAARRLEPALTLESYIAAVKRAAPGQSAGYGRQYVAERETWIGTLPIGYGDGIRRAFTNNCDVLVRGRRVPLVGTVSMDNITVELGPADAEPAAMVGDRAVIIGSDGAELQSAEELARRIGTINYEIVCGLSARVARAYERDGEPV